MTRVALVAPAGSLRSMLVQVAQAGCVEIDTDTGEPGSQAATASDAAVLPASEPDLAALAGQGRDDLIAGERQLRQHAAGAVLRHSAHGLAGWMPADQLDALGQTLTAIGCAAVPMPRPPGSDVPTLMTVLPGQQAAGALVSTYGTVPYADISPSWLAFGSYVLMFGAVRPVGGEQ